MLLVIPLFAYSGLGQSYYFSKFAQEMGTDWIGWVMIVFGGMSTAGKHKILEILVNFPPVAAKLVDRFFQVLYLLAEFRIK